MLHRSTILTPVLLSALLLAVAACGDDDGGDSPSGDGDRRVVSGGEALGPADEGIDGVTAFRIDSTAHTEDPLEYDPSPPAGGEHFPVPGTCGFYSSDPPPFELLVHSIEHGAVWIAYDPDLDDGQLDALRSLVAEQAKVMATPSGGLPSSLVVTAWARQLELDSVDDARLMQFVEIYRNADTAPEPAAPCQGAGNPDVTSPAA